MAPLNLSASLFTQVPRVALLKPRITKSRKKKKKSLHSSHCWGSNLVLGSREEMVSGDPLEEGMATHSSILAWRIPWTAEPGGLPSIGS